jgi:L-lactate permease
MLLTFFRRIGALRTGLAVITLLVVSAAPFADGSMHIHDWRLFPSVIAPAVMMILVFVLPLDMMMAKVFMVDAADDERGRLRVIVRFELFQLILVALAWSPFVLKVLDLSLFG